MKNLLQNLTIAAKAKKQCEKDLINIDSLYQNLSKLRAAASNGETCVWIRLPNAVSQNVIDEARRITGCDVRVAIHCKQTLEIDWKE